MRLTGCEAMAADLVVDALHHRYGSVVALERADLTVHAGELVALLGPSGSGKSTLLAAVAGMLEPTSGRVTLGGRDLLALPAERRGLGMVFQDYALWPHMRVEANVRFPLERRRVPRAQARERAMRALARVGLDGFERRRPSELSGGQQQRVALARAIVAEPELLLLDEPLSALDPDTRAGVRSELATLLRELGITTVLVTHDRDDAFELADRVAVLLDGRVTQIGAPEAVFERPATLGVARFLGLNVVRGVSDRPGLARVGESVLELPDGAPLGPIALTFTSARLRPVTSANVGERGVLRCRVSGHRYTAAGHRVRVTPAGVDETLALTIPDAPSGDTLFVYVPPEALHVLPDGPPEAAARAA
jgi:putative spermidine/putrescine transport system ATP-binding protein